MTYSDDSHCRAAGGFLKLTYRSKAKAKRASRSVRGGRPGQMTGTHLRPYRCHSCGLWHLTKRRDS